MPLPIYAYAGESIPYLYSPYIALSRMGEQPAHFPPSLPSINLLFILPCLYLVVEPLTENEFDAVET